MKGDEYIFQLPGSDLSGKTFAGFVQGLLDRLQVERTTKKKEAEQGQKEWTATRIVLRSWTDKRGKDEAEKRNGVA